MNEKDLRSRLEEITDHLDDNDPNFTIVQATQQAVQLGCFLIGTAESQPEHIPQIQTYTDYRDRDRKISLTDDPGKKVLQVTWAANLAIEGAVLGDFNIPDQRQKMGHPLTQRPYTYGYHLDVTVYSNGSTDEGLGLIDVPPRGELDLILHAEQPLLGAVQRNPDVSGNINVVYPNEVLSMTREVNLPDGTVTVVDRPGIYVCIEPLESLATWVVRGRDLWKTNISSDFFRAS